MRWLALIAGLVFTASGLKALFAYDAGTAVLSRPVLLGISVLCALVFFFLFARAAQSAREVSHFEQWLQANAPKIMAGGATYNGRKVTPDTEVKRFLLTVSVVIMTFKIPSRYYFATRDNFQLTQVLYTLASLLLGWWGIPWGPIYTVQAIAKNLSGGYRITVGEYLATPAAQRAG